MKRRLCIAAVCIGMLLVLVLPAWAAEYGEANVSHVYDNAPHSISTGRGTAADGWLDEAAAFWEEQTK